jgi:hypothetical protein
VAKKAARAELSTQLSSKDEMGWLVAMAVAFLIVHIVAGTIMMRASPGASAVAASAEHVVSDVYD